jgi:SAM-dependent methyltransferase
MSLNAEKYIKYPLYIEGATSFERLMLRMGWGGPIKCTVCGSLAFMKRIKENLRESCDCSACGATNRKRQIALIVCDAVRRTLGGGVDSIRDLPKYPNLVIYNTETGGALSRELSRMKNYFSSEYFGEGHKSGETVNGKMHQDLMALSFENESIDFVISSDVFEHIPYPYKAHEEIYRVLRPKGRHIFTVPFYKTRFLDESRTSIDAEGNITHTMPPLRHGDPVRPEGALVHNIFALEMVVNLARIGFRTNVYLIHSYWRGILGSGAVVFEAIKDQAVSV